MTTNESSTGDESKRGGGGGAPDDDENPYDCNPAGDGGDDGDGNESYNLQAFKSTPRFIESLTELSVQILNEECDKKRALINGLNEINKGLPANIYIPFVNNAWRNYAVLNICPNESKLFLTKTRAPYMICLEIYRPEEILITAQRRYQQILTPQS